MGAKKMNFFKQQALQEMFLIGSGQARKVDGKLQMYTDLDKNHMKEAEANRNAQYQDISSSSMLGRYSGDASSEEGMPKKKKMAISTLLGGSSVLGG